MGFLGRSRELYADHDRAVASGFYDDEDFRRVLVCNAADRRSPVCYIHRYRPAGVL